MQGNAAGQRGVVCTLHSLCFHGEQARIRGVLLGNAGNYGVRAYRIGTLTLKLPGLCTLFSADIAPATVELSPDCWRRFCPSSPPSENGVPLWVHADGCPGTKRIYKVCPAPLRPLVLLTHVPSRHRPVNERCKFDGDSRGVVGRF